MWQAHVMILWYWYYIYIYIHNLLYTCMYLFPDSIQDTIDIHVTYVLSNVYSFILFVCRFPPFFLEGDLLGFLLWPKSPHGTGIWFMSKLHLEASRWTSQDVRPQIFCYGFKRPFLPFWIWSTSESFFLASENVGRLFLKLDRLMKR